MWWTRYRKKALSISAFKFCSDRMAQIIAKTFQGFWLAWKNAIIKMKSLTPIFWLIILEKVKFVPSFKEEAKNKKMINTFEVKLFLTFNHSSVINFELNWFNASIRFPCNPSDPKTSWCTDKRIQIHNKRVAFLQLF